MADDTTAAKSATEQHFKAVMQLVYSACYTTGWEIELGESDDRTYRHGLLEVSRPLDQEAAGIETLLDAAPSRLVRVFVRPRTKNRAALALLEERINEDLRVMGILKPAPAAPEAPPTMQLQGVAMLEHMLKHFHAAALHLRHRRETRPTLTIADEYDVQYLLHSMLTFVFEDVRAEDYVPSYAGGSSRVDFLLKPERIVLEAKFVRATLSDKDIGAQLVIDTARYRTHPDCRVLVFFVYDPEHHLKSPRGIESDLTRETEGIDVRVLILPR